LIYENIVVVGVVSASSLKDCLRNKRLLLLPLLWVCLLFVLTPRELILLEEAGVKYQKNLLKITNEPDSWSVEVRRVLWKLWG